MPLIDKDKTVEAVATYLFVNDAIRGPEPKKVRDYLVFAAEGCAGTGRGQMS